MYVPLPCLFSSVSPIYVAYVVSAITHGFNEFIAINIRSIQKNTQQFRCRLYS
jgi:hypothetical protein